MNSQVNFGIAAPVEIAVAEIVAAARAQGPATYEAVLRAAIRAFEVELVDARVALALALEAEQAAAENIAIQDEDEDEEDGQWYPAYWRDYYPSGN